METSTSLPQEVVENDEPLALNLAKLADKGFVKMKGPSGRPLRISASRGYINIDALDAKDIYLHMGVITNEDGRYLTLGINTRGPVGEPQHPDLFAGKLVDKAIAFFERETPLKGLEFNWRNDFQSNKSGRDQPSDNLLEYRDTRASRLEQYRREGLAEDEALTRAKKDAAFSTWTGRRLALKHGFTEIENMEEKSDDGGVFRVKGEFVRPSEHTVAKVD